MRACGGKLFAKSLAKNFKSLAFYKQSLIGAVVSTSKARAEQGSAGALPMPRKFLGKFENPFFKKGFQKKSSRKLTKKISQKRFLIVISR